MKHALLEVTSIEKFYDSIKAVDRLSFDVREGEIFALLGPNGAGKTTVVRMLLRIIHPDRGTILYRLNGQAREKALPHEIGYLPEDRGLYREIPIIQTLTFMGILRGMRRQDASRAAGDWLERLELGQRRNHKMDQLSKGNQQKVQFIASILHRPRFAILDEPFSGLDPVNQEFILNIIRELRADGMTILLSAHQMDLVQRLSDRVFLINRGKGVLSGTMAEVRASVVLPKKIILRLAGAVQKSQFDHLNEIDHCHALPDGEFAISLRPGISLSRFLGSVSSSLDINDIRSEAPSLHDIFLEAIANSRKEAERVP